MKPELYALRKKAMTGDTEAIAAILDHALQAIGILDNLTSAPAGHPELPEAIRQGVAAAHELARRSPRWPAALDSVKELRETTLARWQRLEVGSATGIRLIGKNRGFSYDEQAGFALDVFNELEAARKDLPPLTNETLPAWLDAGMTLCREWCEGNFDRFPWPDCVSGKIGTSTDGNGNIRTAESAVRGKLKDGLKTLI